VFGQITSAGQLSQVLVRGSFMKKLFSIFVGMVMLWALVGHASAQPFFENVGTSGVSALPFHWTNSTYRHNNTYGAGLLGTSSIYFGWLEHPNGSTWSLQRQGDSGTAPWPLRGYWLGASQEFFPNERFGFLISGSLFLPRRSAGTWYNELHTSTFDFEIQSYNWGSVDGLAKLRMCGGVDILGGFRWDHTSTRVRYSDNTDDDYILNAYLPLLGIQIGNNFSGGSFLVRFVGAPKVYGQLRYHFWDNQGFAEFGDFGISDGYFMELLVDYSMRFRGNMNIGGFVKGNSFHCKTDRQSLSGSTAEPVFWNVEIRSWTVGATLSLAFASPF
jgi:hypothetical protein